MSCKDKRILKKFLHFLTKINFLSISLKSFPKNKKRKFVTVLKSPHVNKTAQEQFEFRLYSKHLLIHSFKPLTFLLFLKKLNSLSFTGLNLEVKSFIANPRMYKHTLKVVNPDNIILNNSKTLNLRKKHFNKNSKQVAKNCNSNFSLCRNYIQLFDLYGEICLTKVFHSEHSKSF
jgi:ribosomal protein S10